MVLHGDDVISTEGRLFVSDSATCTSSRLVRRTEISRSLPRDGVTGRIIGAKAVTCQYRAVPLIPLVILLHCLLAPRQSICSDGPQRYVLEIVWDGYLHAR